MPHEISIAAQCYGTLCNSIFQTVSSLDFYINWNRTEPNRTNTTCVYVHPVRRPSLKLSAVHSRELMYDDTLIALAAIIQMVRRNRQLLRALPTLFPVKGI